MTHKKAPLNLQKDPIPRLFFYYFFPAFFGLLILSTDVFFDGLFIGRKIGALGLAAINLCVPIFSFFISLELLFSFGGAVLASAAMGRGDEREAREIFNSIFYFALIFSISLGIGLFAHRYELARFLGAEGNLQSYVLEYLGVIVLAAPIIIIHPLLEAFVRNDKAPYLAMSSMIVGSLSNIAMNYTFIFVFSWGLFGAALSTALSHCIGIILLLSHFIFKRGTLYFSRFFIHLPVVWRAVKNGISPAFTEITTGIVIALYNFKIIRVMGEEGVAIAGAVGYIGMIAVMTLIALAQGLQPIASFNHGAREHERVREIFNFTFKIALLLGVAIYTLSLLFASQAAALFFPDDPRLVIETANVMKIYYAGYLFLGVNILTATFFQSIERTKPAFLVSVSYNFIFVVMWLEILPHFLGGQGIWLSYPVAMASGFLLALLVLWQQGRSGLRG